MSMGSRAISWVFPLTLAVIMGGISFWLNRATDVNIETSLLDPGHPQYEMKGLEGVRFNAEGMKSEMLQAASAQMFPNSTDVIFVNPNGHAYNQGKELYRVLAPEAKYSRDQKKIFFDQNVLFIKTDADGKQAGEVNTSKIQIDIPTQVVKTDQVVQYQYGLSKGTATGFSYDKKNEVLHLDSRVKAIIYDKP